MNREETEVLVDGHIHIYRIFDISTFIASSTLNLMQFRKKKQQRTPCACFLFFLEAKGSVTFDELCIKLLGGSSKHEVFLRDNTLCVDACGEEPLYIVQGRQIVTQEGLEVLVIGANYEYLEGLSVIDIFEQLEKQSDCLVILPWGVGKWIGKRGRLIKEIIKSRKKWPLHIALGDNGNRPKFWALPDVFAEAAGRGVLNLPGSDPLPFAHHGKRGGSSGFTVSLDFDKRFPFSSLKEKLLERPETVKTFGESYPLGTFLFDQFYMQVKKRRS